MHESSMRRMEWFIKEFIDPQKHLKVLDVGSYDVNGSYKKLFEKDKFSYTGLDMANGPNVDIVPSSAYSWTEIQDNEYDVVISGQALEHIEYFWITMGEIVRVTAKDGLICIIAPNGFKEHRYPVDCWRFFTDGMVALARYYQLEVVHAHTNAAPSMSNHDWYSEDCADAILIAKKKYSGDPKIIDLENYKCLPSVHKEIGSNMITYEDYLAEKIRLGNHDKEEEIIGVPREKKEGLIQVIKRKVKNIVQSQRK